MEQIEELRKYSREVVREFGFFKNHYEDTDATHGETHILIELKRLGALEVGELARILNIDKSGASKMLTKLQAKGWVKDRLGKLDDARKKTFQLTTVGSKVTDQIEARANKKIEMAFAELSSGEREAVVSGMEKLVKSLKVSRAKQEFTIRTCTRNDDAQMASIVRRALKDLGLKGSGTVAEDPSLNYLSSFNSGRQCYYVAEKNGRILGGAGIASMEGEPRTVCELIRMFLHPEVRSSGVSQLLLDKSLSRAKELGYKIVYLETTSRMKAAQRLYLKNGFEFMQNRRGETGHFSCNVFMQKRID